MTDSSKDALELDEDPLQDILKPRVISVPKDSLKRIFGTSQVFQGFSEPKPKAKGLTVPLKVREYFFQGQACLEQEDWETAVLLFSRALHLDPRLVDFYALRAEAYIQLCDFSSAVQNLRRAYSFEPENTKFQERLTLVLHLQGQCLFEQCAYQDALFIFSQASELQPQEPCFRYRCMACLLALGRHQDCLTLVTKELKHGTTNADVYVLRARLYNFFHKPTLCYRDLHSTLLLEPKHPQAKLLLKTMVNQAQQARQSAEILAVQGNMQHALTCINCAIENNPLDPSLFLFRGTLYRRLQEFDVAVEDFLKALDMVPESQEDMVQQVQRQLLLAYNDFAVHCYMQGAYQESLLLLSKALKDEQQEKGLYINRGDCFFQLGNLAFAEADYQQALALSPQDQGANLRMSLLQEKMGFCEQKRRQFHKAENHFSLAIQHNPQKARYYLQRAKNRQLLQNSFGARQDVATVLLLEPEQPQLLPLMTSLFPGMSVDDVLNSQVAHLARLQLERAVESNMQFSIPKGIVGLLRKRELERQKARALQHEWKLEQPSSEELKAPYQALQEGPEEEAVAPEKEKEKEEETEHTSDKEMSLSSSYVDLTSSGSILGFIVTSISETETSTNSQGYRSSSTAAVTSSDSSLLKIQSSDSGTNGEDSSLSQSPSKTEDTQGPRRRPTETEDTQGPRRRSTKTEDTQGRRDTQGPRRRSSETEDTQGPRRRSSETEDTQGRRVRSSGTEDTQGPRRRSTKTEDTQGRRVRSSETEDTQGPRRRSSGTKDTQGPRQRFRKAKAPQGRSWGLRKFPTRGQAWGLLRSSSKTKDFYDLNESPSNTDVPQGGSQRPSKTEAVQGGEQRPCNDDTTQGQDWGPSPSPSMVSIFYDPSHKSSKDEATQDQSQRLSKTNIAQGWSQRFSKTEDVQGWNSELSPRSSKTKAAQSPSQSARKTEAMQGPSQGPCKTESAQSWGQGPSSNSSKNEYSWDPSYSPTQGLSQSPTKSRDEQGSSPSPSRNTAP
ncbi:tetratricopeptide repeat protein 16 [Orycteropus afer afer]|uniref:Tetratricopeptide repeat protein 16 n=1 Tax=Orycteropus afer afer TaxID=1230840 RepID=A0A8B7A3N1_ORYAF|nr:tetratricopeptide repeat protein 16 [Orycteropus afer afer]